MYEPGTILALKEPKSTEELNFPYDKVTVVGQSPIDHGGAVGGNWTGPDGQGVIIQPITSFGSTLDEPFGKLRSIYDVESIPEQIIEAPQVRVVNSTSGSAGPTPEEVFAEASAGQPKSPTRVRTPIGSPLDEIATAAAPPASPLDAPATPRNGDKMVDEGAPVGPSDSDIPEEAPDAG
jgi:hypothetical protein